MALSGPGLASEIETALQGITWNGVQLNAFSQAIGLGVVTPVSGLLTFTTTDNGTVPGSGTGTGSGITGLDVTNIADLMFDTGQTFWAPSQNNGPGVQWRLFCDTVSQTIVDHFANNAELTSTHSPVFVGTGDVTAYAGVLPPVMAASIVSFAPPTWAAARFPELAQAVALGVMTEILTHSPADSVTIVGSPSGTPVPGAGTGTGIVL